MAYYRYSKYQYETSPRKVETEYKPIKRQYQKKSSSISKKQKSSNTKKQIKSQIKIITYICLIFASLLVIGYRNSLINENFNANEKLKSNLAAIEKENEQLKVNLENSLNLSNIEKMAEQKLGMQKLDNSQKIYVSLDKEDYIETASEEVVLEEEKNWFEELVDFIFGK